MTDTEKKKNKWWGSEEQKEAIRDAYRPYPASVKGYISGMDTLRPVVGKTIGFFMNSPWRIFRMFSLLTRQAMSLSPERDDYTPKSVEPKMIYRESKAHYNATDAQTNKLITMTYHSFNLWMIVATALFLIGFYFRQPDPIVPIMFFGLSFVTLLRAHLAMIRNWVLRNQSAPGIKAIWASPDRLPQKAR